MDFSWTDASKLVTTMIASVGGGGFIIWKFSAFLGNHWAKELLQKKEYDYKANLESLKKEYELDFEKALSKYARYTEHQFNLYNALWRTLMELKLSGETLSTDASISNLRAFAIQLSETKNDILKSALLIEDEHYLKLIELLDEFSNYQFGKMRLIDLRLKKAATPEMNIRLREQLAIFLNDKVRKVYHSLLEEILVVFKRQIRIA